MNFYGFCHLLSAKILLYTLNSTDAFSRQLCHIPNGIAFLQ